MSVESFNCCTTGVSEESKRGVAFISSLVSCWHFCFFVCKAVDEFLISVCYNYSIIQISNAEVQR